MYLLHISASTYFFQETSTGVLWKTKNFTKEICEILNNIFFSFWKSHSYTITFKLLLTQLVSTMTASIHTIPMKIEYQSIKSILFIYTCFYRKEWKAWNTSTRPRIVALVLENVQDRHIKAFIYWYLHIYYD